jgi:hypothetical protein
MLNGSTNDNPSTEKNVLSDAVIMTKDGQEPDERQAIGRVKK